MKPATVTEIQAKVLESLSLGPKDCDILQDFRCCQNAMFVAVDCIALNY